MQVDTEPFPINMIDFDGKKVLIRPSATDKGKGKEVIIGNAQEVDEITKNSCKKVVTERTPDGGETLKVTITTSNTGDRRRRVTERGSLFCMSRTIQGIDADGPRHHRTVRIFQADDPTTPRSHDDHVPSNHDDQ